MRRQFKNVLTADATFHLIKDARLYVIKRKSCDNIMKKVKLKSNRSSRAFKGCTMVMKSHHEKVFWWQQTGTNNNQAFVLLLVHLSEATNLPSKG